MGLGNLLEGDFGEGARPTIYKMLLAVKLYWIPMTTVLGMGYCFPRINND